MRLTSHRPWQSVGFKLGQFLVSAALDLCISPLSLAVEEVSPSCQTHLTENGATAELIGAPRAAGKRGALD